MTDAEFKAVQEIKRLLWQKLFKGNPPEGAWKDAQYNAIENAMLKYYNVSSIADASAKSIKRFVELAPNSDIDNIRSKNPLAYFALEESIKFKSTISSEKFKEFVEKYENENDETGVYKGKYRIFLVKKNMSFNEKNFGIISIQKMGYVTFSFDTEEFEGNVKLKGNHLFFQFENKAEIIYLTIIVGTSKGKRYLNFLGGVLSAIKDKELMPYSSIALLIKQDQIEELDINRIKEAYNYASKYNLSELDKKILDFLNIDINLENALSSSLTEEEKNILKLKGSWYAYTISRDLTLLHRGGLIIKNKHSIHFLGENVDYKHGEVKIVGQDLYIYGNSDIKNMVISAKLDYKDLSKINEIIGGFLTIGSTAQRPVIGSVILQKESDDIVDLEILSFNQNSNIYKEWQENKRLDKLNSFGIE